MRRRMARAGLLDVHRNERRPRGRRSVRRQYEQTKFRGTAGAGRPDLPGKPTHGRGDCRDRRDHRCPHSGLTMPTLEAFRTLTSTAVVLPHDDIDTDQIIPARFLPTTERSGLGAHLFNDWRYDKAGVARADFPLNAAGAPAAGPLSALA